MASHPILQVHSVKLISSVQTRIFDALMDMVRHLPHSTFWHCIHCGHVTSSGDTGIGVGIGVDGAVIVSSPSLSFPSLISVGFVLVCADMFALFCEECKVFSLFLERTLTFCAAFVLPSFFAFDFDGDDDGEMMGA